MALSGPKPGNCPSGNCVVASQVVKESLLNNSGLIEITYFQEHKSTLVNGIYQQVKNYKTWKNWCFFEETEPARVAKLRFRQTRGD